jgi:hypothetical protein
MIFVDKDETEDVPEDQRFAYTNCQGDVECVLVSKALSAITFMDDDRDEISEIHCKDIPKLILALQAAYDFKFKGEA